MTQTVDPFDELAALFLTEADAKRGEGRDTGGGARGGVVELLLMGHLPVRAALWLVPYVDAVARKAGPAALVRLDGEEPSLEVIRRSTEALDPTPQTLREAIGQASHVARLWIVRPAAAASSSELLKAGPHRITILSGADQAAVVKAYELIKSLSEAADEKGESLPPLGLAVLGGDESRAQEVTERLNRTTRSFLDLELPLVACVPRMEADIVASGFQRFTGEPCPQLVDLLEWIRESEATAATAASAPSKPREEPVISEPAPPHTHTHTPTHTPTHEPPTTESQPQRAPAAPRREQPALVCQSCGAPVKLVPRPQVEFETKAAEAAGEPDQRGEPVPLAEYVDDVTLIAVRCPSHERIELGIDGSGRLHLLGREPLLREMRIVETWARAHRELIAMACQGTWIDPAGQVICHVFTEEPVSVADLHGSDLRLHLLTPVVVEGRRGWYSAPLNAVVR